MPLFSVIIAAYNRERLIAATLASVFAQQHAATDYEVIVVDDGSTDGTAEVVRSFAGVQLVLQLNQGAGAARNHGVAKSSGQYLAFLDSDDLWFPWTMTVYAEAIRQGNRPAFIAGKPLVFTGDAPMPGAYSKAAFLVFPDYYRSSDEWRWWGASSFVIQRDIYLGIDGFVTGALSRHINGEDCDVTMQLGTARGFVQISNPVTFGYREHDANIRKIAEKNIGGACYLIDKETADKYPGGVERRRERWEILGRQIRPAILLCLQVGRFGDAWRMYRQTLRWHLALGRARFLAAFFALAAMHVVKCGFARSGLIASQRSDK